MDSSPISAIDVVLTGGWVVVMVVLVDCSILSILMGLCFVFGVVVGVVGIGFPVVETTLNQNQLKFKFDIKFLKKFKPFKLM